MASYNTFDSSFKSPLGDPSDPGKYQWTGENPHNLDPGQIDWSNLGAKSAAHKRQMIGNYMTTGQVPGGQNVQELSMPHGGAGGGGAAQGSGTPEANAQTMADFGAGLLDPNSDMSKRWMERMRNEIGSQTDAAERAAGYRAAQSGFGVGASPELLAMQNDIGVSGLEAAGRAGQDFLMRAPQMGLGALGTATGQQVGMRGQDLQSKIESQRDQLQREMANMNNQMRQRELDMQRRYQDQQIAMQQQSMAMSPAGREMAYSYSGTPGSMATQSGRVGGGYVPVMRNRGGHFAGIRR